MSPEWMRKPEDDWLQLGGKDAIDDVLRDFPPYPSMGSHGANQAFVTIKCDYEEVEEDKEGFFDPVAADVLIDGPAIIFCDCPPYEPVSGKPFILHSEDCRVKRTAKSLDPHMISG